MEKPFTLSLFLVLLLWSFTASLAIVPTNFTDQSALLAFKSGIIFDPNNILARNWSIGTNFCDWIGVSCSHRRQRVTALQLPHLGLRGTISPRLSNLSFLALLDLSNNSFDGHLPNELGFLPRLKILSLYENQLKGAIPPSLCHCRTVEKISLSYNNFTGGIPEELGMLPQLTILYLGGNILGGSIPSSLANISTLTNLGLEANALLGSIPSIIFNITSLIEILLWGNFFSGSLPIDMCQNNHNLQIISLSKNQITGHIPSTIYKCRELREIWLHDNIINGSLPTELSQLSKLQVLRLDNNNLFGMIPHSLGNLSSLTYLSAGYNQIYGNIPNIFWHFPNLVELNFLSNALSGFIPHEIFNISTLRIISLAFNALSGNLPLTIGLWLPNLETLFLHSNDLSGNIPLHLSNSSNLRALSLGKNLFVGSVPVNLANLQVLEQLTINDNQLTGDGESLELSFIAALLTNCRFLKKLNVGVNPLNGFLPSSIGNYSSPIQEFYAYGCQIQGHIPKWFGSYKHLHTLSLEKNRLSGAIPSKIGGLSSLQRLSFAYNMLQGSIPNELCFLKNLGELYLSNNLFSRLPTCMGNLSYLQKLDLSFNRLNSSIPLSLWIHANLIIMNLSINSLQGHIPLVAKLDVVEVLDLSSNRISGDIPSTLGSFQRMSCLNLSKNQLQGVIPQTFGSLVALDFIDLSYNNLSGAIPKSLEGIKYLKQLNLSFNNLSGEIPSNGPFANFTADSFLHNAALCGKPTLQVPHCSHKTSRFGTKETFFRYVVPVLASLAITIVCYYVWRSFRRVHHARAPNPTLPLLPTLEWPMVSYQELLHATESFSEANLLGAGSFSYVYRGMLSNGMIVAVKVLNIQSDDAFKSFDAECKVFQIARHRNLVKVISSCSNSDFKALILQYVSNGSLEKWLYSDNYFLSLYQRVSIMVDVALALEYLHFGLEEPIIHCDVKPSNVLLDEDMVAHVGDFGIAKILEENKTITRTKTLGTLGYIAPEYGSEGKVSSRCDVFSYGIMLLEVLTRKKPTDEMFSESLSLRQWVLAAFPDNIIKIIDDNLPNMEDETVTTRKNQILSLFELGLECSNELTEERSDMKEVAIKIKKIQSQLLPHRKRRMA